MIRFVDKKYRGFFKIFKRRNISNKRAFKMLRIRIILTNVTSVTFFTKSCWIHYSSCVCYPRRNAVHICISTSPQNNLTIKKWVRQRKERIRKHQESAWDRRSTLESFRELFKLGSKCWYRWTEAGLKC